MGILFLILFVISEVVLVVLTFTKFSEKVKWLRNRAIVTGVEFILLLGVILLPTTYMKWRFFCALIVLFIRLAIAGISWLVKRKKAVGTKKKVGRIVSCVLSVVIMTVSLILTFVFANYNGLETTGEFEIMESNAILIDQSRKEEFESDGSFREVPVHFYYPDSNGEFPLVVFSHGAFGYYQSNYSTYSELASHGYVVAALDHSYHAFFTEDTDGNIVIVDNKFITDAMEFSNGNKSEEEAFIISQEWMKLRTEDESFVLDTIKSAKDSGKLSDSWYTENDDEIFSVISKTDTDKIGLIGHSMGGATAVALGRERSDIDAVIDLDGTMLGEIISVKDGKYEYIRESYPVPLLDFRKESDYNKMEQLKNERDFADSYVFGFAYANDYVVKNAENSRTVIFQNVGHMDFTDLPLFSPFLSSMLGKGEVKSEEFLPMMNGVILNWFDYYLKDEGTLDIQAKY